MSLHRSNSGLLLGVFKGVAQSQGWPVLLTRIIGFIGLLFIACVLGAGGLAKYLVAGFFYLLAAVLLPPERRWSRYESDDRSTF